LACSTASPTIFSKRSFLFGSGGILTSAVGIWRGGGCSGGSDCFDGGALSVVSSIKMN
jgi:hypothetical protein